MIAVRSITLKFLFKTSEYVILLNFFASLYFIGSLSYTPSTFVPFKTISALSSFARNAAAESVVKNGLPVPPLMMTIRPFSRCLIALHLIYGSAIWETLIAERVRVSQLIFSKAS